MGLSFLQPSVLARKAALSCTAGQMATMPRIAVGSVSERVLGAGCALALFCSLALGQTSEPSSPAPKASPKKTNSHSATKTSNSGAHPSRTTSHTSTKGSSGKGKNKNSKRSVSHRGQQKIDPERTRQIQQALVREHYLSGEPSGKWDPATEDALQRYQADHGWQNKTVPDSRALIKLGLGPSHDHLLNPESAMTTAPQAPRGNAPSPVPAGNNDPVDPPATRPQP